MMPTVRRTSPTAWVVDDNGKSRADACDALRSIGVHATPIVSDDEFLNALATASGSAPAPDLVVLDLRLPWGDEASLVQNALVAGLTCLQRLREAPATRHVPVIVFSAFVDDDLVKNQLRPYRPAAIIDKLEKARLPVVAENVLPDRAMRTRDVVQRLGLKGEHQVVRVGALIGAVTAIVTLRVRR
jgi:CheY-like chemotaxis protein